MLLFSVKSLHPVLKFPPLFHQIPFLSTIHSRSWLPGFLAFIMSVPNNNKYQSFNKLRRFVELLRFLKLLPKQDSPPT